MVKDDRRKDIFTVVEEVDAVIAQLEEVLLKLEKAKEEEQCPNRSQ